MGGHHLKKRKRNLPCRRARCPRPTSARCQWCACRSCCSTAAAGVASRRGALSGASHFTSVTLGHATQNPHSGPAPPAAPSSPQGTRARPKDAYVPPGPAPRQPPFVPPSTPTPGLTHPPTQTTHLGLVLPHHPREGLLLLRLHRQRLLVDHDAAVHHLHLRRQRRPGGRRLRRVAPAGTRRTGRRHRLAVGLGLLRVVVVVVRASVWEV